MNQYSKWDKKSAVVEYITKSTGQFLKELMSMPGNSSYYRLLTIDHKINFDQRVQLLASIYRYAVINFWFQFRCSPAYIR